MILIYSTNNKSYNQIYSLVLPVIINTIIVKKNSSSIIINNQDGNR